MLTRTSDGAACPGILPAGTLIGEQYRILGLLGQGGQSRVYLALDEKTGIRRAVKILRADAQEACIAQRCILLEAEFLQNLRHPCIPAIVDLIPCGRNLPPIIVMEYIAGTPLSAVLKERGTPAPAQAIRWALRICEILSWLHAQTPPIIYRDLKPANIILRPDGDLALVDFGSARRLRTSASARDAEGIRHPDEDTIPLGTKGYAAPEQFGGHGQSDMRTDVYALGATLYHLLTGGRPSAPAGAHRLPDPKKPQIPAALQTVVGKCLQPDPSKRYASCAELRRALLACRVGSRRAVFRAAVLRFAACAALAAPAVGFGVLARAHIADARELSPLMDEITSADAPETPAFSAPDGAQALTFYMELADRINRNREALLAAGVKEEALDAIIAYINLQLSSSGADAEDLTL